MNVIWYEGRSTRGNEALDDDDDVVVVDVDVDEPFVSDVVVAAEEE